MHPSFSGVQRGQKQGTEKYLPPPPREQEKEILRANLLRHRPYGRYGNAGKTSKTIPTIAILWPVKAIFEKRAATVEVDPCFSPEKSRSPRKQKIGAKKCWARKSEIGEDCRQASAWIWGASFLGGLNRAHTNGGVQQRTLLRRVLRRVLEIAFEKVLRRVLRRCLAGGFNGKKGSENGS